MTERRKCRVSTCQTEVLFVRTVNNKTQIVDAKPEKRIVLFDAITGAILGKDSLDNTEGEMAPRAKVVDTFVDHHATCTQSQRFRKPLKVVDGGQAERDEGAGT